MLLLPALQAAPQLHAGSHASLADCPLLPPGALQQLQQPLVAADGRELTLQDISGMLQPSAAQAVATTIRNSSNCDMPDAAESKV